MSYEEFFEAYHYRLVLTVNKLLKDWHVSEEVAQETMLKAWQQWDEIQPKLVQWMFLVARREAIDILRKRNRIAWLPILEIDEEGPGNLEEMQAVGDMIGHLPEYYQKAIILHIEGYSHQETADPRQSKYRLANARKKLRTMYHQEAS